MAYRGTQATIPLGELGLFTDLPSDKLPPNALIRANNVVLYNGNVQKAPGALKYNSSALPAGVVAVHDWFPTLTQQRLIAVTSAGSIYRDEGGRNFNGNVAINTGLGTLNANCVFVDGGQETGGRVKKLFLFTNGVAQVRVLSGDDLTFTSIDVPATDWIVGAYPKFGLVHRNRLWAFGGQKSYASNSGDHENFVTAALFDSIYPGEGGELLGAFVFKGRLFAFKDGGFVYYLNDQDTDSDNWYWQKLASNFGLAAPNAITEAINDMFAGNTTGTITSYSAAQSLGDINSGDVTQLMQMEAYLRANTSKVGVTQQHAIYYPEKKLMFFTYRSAYFTYNDMLVVIDVNAQKPRCTFWRKGSPQCLALRKDTSGIPRPMYGDKDGYVMLADYEDRLEGSTAYTGEFQTTHTDFSYLAPELRTKEKHFDWLSVTYVPEASHNLSCDYFIDGRFVETITFPMEQYLRPALGTLTLDTDRLAQSNTETVKARLSGTGRTFSARFYNSGSNQSFQVSSITVGFRAGTEKAQKV